MAKPFHLNFDKVQYFISQPYSCRPHTHTSLFVENSAGNAIHVSLHTDDKNHSVCVCIESKNGHLELARDSHKKLSMKWSNGDGRMNGTNVKLFQWLRARHKYYTYFVRCTGAPLDFLHLHSLFLFIYNFFFRFFFHSPCKFYCFCLIMIHLGVELTPDTQSALCATHINTRFADSNMKIIHFHRINGVGNGHNGTGHKRREKCFNLHNLLCSEKQCDIFIDRPTDRPTDRMTNNATTDQTPTRFDLTSDITFVKRKRGESYDAERLILWRENSRRVERKERKKNNCADNSTPVPSFRISHLHFERNADTFVVEPFRR